MTEIGFRSAPIPATDNSACKAALKEAVAYLSKVEQNQARAMDRCRLWANIAELSTKLGDREGAKKAIAFAKEAASELKGNEELRTIGTELGRLGDAAQVIELAKPILGNGHPRETILQEAAYAAADMGHFQAAMQMANELTKEYAEWVTKDIKRMDFIFRSKNGIP